MRRFALLVVFAVAVGGALWAQPKVAVLDAVVPNNIDQSVVIPVTEKVIERIVISKRFTVLDRANVGQVLKEREFQLSGLVSDAEVTEAGKYLGADFVVVAKVQRVAETYFLTAKMIDVKTGVIANQTSAESEGRLSVLIGMAEKVGNTLAGSATAADRTARVEPKPAEPVAAPVKAPAAKKPAADTVGLRLYAGFGGGTQDMSDSSGDYGPFDVSGIDLYALWGVFSRYCVAASVTYLDGSSSSDGYYIGSEVTSLSVGLGYAMPMGLLMPWFAVKVGTTAMSWGVDSSGTELAVDVGLDARLGSLLLGVRYQLQAGVLAADGYADVALVQNSFFLMLGYRF